MSELLDELPTAHLEYSLRDGAVGDWLVLGPLSAPLPAPRKIDSRQSWPALAGDAEEILQPPAERATSTVTVVQGVTQQGVWRVVNTLEDDWVDLAQWVSAPHAVCAWLYAQVVLRKRIEAPLALMTAGPAQVWINGEAVYTFSETPASPTQQFFATSLPEGTNEILIRVANVGQGDLPMMVALAIPGAEGMVTLPTIIEPVARRQKLATVMGHAYLAQDVYSREQHIILRWPTDLAMLDALTARLQTPSGRIFGEANPMVQKGAKVDFGEAAQFPDGRYEILLQPQFEEYYVQDMRVQRRIPLQIRNGKWSLLYYGSYEERRQEALADAAKRSGDIYAEIAKSALGQWNSLRHEVIEQALESISQRASGYEQLLLALFGWVARMGDLPDFPQEMAWALEENAPLVLDRLGSFAGENQVVLASCHLLAGQLYGQRSFADLTTGEAHQAHAQEWLLAWLHATAQMGLPAGESQQTLADALLALSHLVDLASSDEVAGMAAAVLDKLAYQIALQSFLGVWGGSQEHCNSEWLLNGRLGPLCGVGRLWWGQGAFNTECAAVVALACAENYLLPEIIAAVGLDRQQENWLQRRDLYMTGPVTLATNRAAFRSGDSLLASAQGDWPAASSGSLWQVTLGPDALIFGNRPRCNSSHGAWQSNYWRGNAAPVRVAQWREVLVIAYAATDQAALPFTHAYFPCALLDEVRFEQGWALARKGNGYVALTAGAGVELVQAGLTAQREVRAAAEAIWLVQIGRATHDGTFAQFAEQVLARPLTVNATELRYQSLRGEAIHFHATGPLPAALQVDDVALPLSDFPHLASIYGGAAALPATDVEIRYLDHEMRLDFGAREMPSAS